MNRLRRGDGERAFRSHPHNAGDMKFKLDENLGPSIQSILTRRHLDARLGLEALR